MPKRCGTDRKEVLAEYVNRGPFRGEGDLRDYNQSKDARSKKSTISQPDRGWCYLDRKIFNSTVAHLPKSRAAGCLHDHFEVFSLVNEQGGGDGL